MSVASSLDESDQAVDQRIRQPVDERENVDRDVCELVFRRSDSRRRKPSTASENTSRATSDGCRYRVVWSVRRHRQSVSSMSTINSFARCLELGGEGVAVGAGRRHEYGGGLEQESRPTSAALLVDVWSSSMLTPLRASGLGDLVHDARSVLADQAKLPTWTGDCRRSVGVRVRR